MFEQRSALRPWLRAVVRGNLLQSLYQVPCTSNQNKRPSIPKPFALAFILYVMSVRVQRPEYSNSRSVFYFTLTAPAPCQAAVNCRRWSHKFKSFQPTQPRTTKLSSWADLQNAAKNAETLARSATTEATQKKMTRGRLVRYTRESPRIWQRFRDQEGLTPSWRSHGTQCLLRGQQDRFSASARPCANHPMATSCTRFRNASCASTIPWQLRTTWQSNVGWCSQ